jgi:hypothetical protein
MVFDETKSGVILDEDTIQSRDWNPNLKTHSTQALDQMHRMMVKKWIHVIGLPIKINENTIKGFGFGFGL